MFSKIFKITAVSVFAFVTALAVSSCSREGARIVIKGSTTVLPITQKTAEVYKQTHPNISISIEGSGSGNGIKALIDGSCEIANASRQMKPEEIEKMKTNGGVPKEIEVGIDMICPIIHPSNQVKNLTTAQLKGIFDGTITNWKQIGGKDDTIVVVSRDTSSGTYEVWHEKVMNKTDVRSDALLQASNGAVVTTVAENPKAIGYIGYGYITENVKAIHVNSVEPTLENGKSKAFPLSRGLYMYINEAKISDQAKAFIDFILSKDGQALVKDAGFIPLR